MNAVELRGVSKIFSLNGGDIRPIDNLTLSLEAGKITVLMGRSGCGKSTLLKLIAGLLTPNAGTLNYGVAREEIGVVFQEPRLLPWKTVKKNVQLGLLNLPPVYPLAFFSLFLTYPRKPHIFDSFKPIVRYHFLYHFPTFPRFSPLSPVSVGVSVGVSGIGFAQNENHLAKIYSYVARWQTLDRP